MAAHFIAPNLSQTKKIHLCGRNRTGRKIHHPKCITKTISYILALGHLGIHKAAGIYQSVQTIDIAAGLPFICG